MLCLVHSYGAAIGYAGADAVGSLHSLRPHGAEPYAPIAELRRTFVVAAMVDGDPVGVAEQGNVARLAHDPVHPIELRLSGQGDLFDGLSGAAQRALAED